MQCLVCGGPAIDIGRKDFDGRVFRCAGKCKDYEVAGSQLLKFLAGNRDQRADALAKAVSLAAPGKRPSIDSRSLRN
jgi:hypothetical protein